LFAPTIVILVRHPPCLVKAYLILTPLNDDI